MPCVRCREPRALSRLDFELRIVLSKPIPVKYFFASICHRNQTTIQPRRQLVRHVRHIPRAGVPVFVVLEELYILRAVRGDFFGQPKCLVHQVLSPPSFYCIALALPVNLLVSEELRGDESSRWGINFIAPRKNHTCMREREYFENFFEDRGFLNNDYQTASQTTTTSWLDSFAIVNPSSNSTPP